MGVIRSEPRIRSPPTRNSSLALYIGYGFDESTREHWEQVLRRKWSKESAALCLNAVV
jgi:hypothetical protein